MQKNVSLSTPFDIIPLTFAHNDVTAYMGPENILILFYCPALLD